MTAILLQRITVFISVSASFTAEDTFIANLLTLKFEKWNKQLQLNGLNMRAGIQNITKSEPFNDK